MLSMGDNTTGASWNGLVHARGYELLNRRVRVALKRGYKYKLKNEDRTTHKKRKRVRVTKYSKAWCIKLWFCRRALGDQVLLW